MRTQLCFLTAALLLPGLAQANELMQVYDLAARNDKTFEAARYGRNASLEAKPQARAALLPQLEASYKYSYADEESSLGGGAPKISHGTNESLGVNLNQSLFSLESWRRLQQADGQVALAQATFRSAEQDLVLRVADAYFAVLGAEDNLRSARAEQAAVERQLEQAKKRFEVGLSAITDVQEAQARYDLTVAQEIQATQQLDTARLALAEITGQGGTGTAPLIDDIPLPAPTPDKVDDWVGSAMDSNLDLLAAQLNYAIAARGVQVARARHLPTLGLTAGYSDNSQKTGALPYDSNGTSVGVGVTLPLFSGGAVRSQVRQAVATRKQRQAQFEGAQRSVERNTRDAFLGVVTGAAQVRAYKQAVVSSQTALEASETGLEVGARTAVDVLNAQQQLYAAERNYLQSRYNYLIAVLRLKAAAGRLTPTDLAEIDKLLVRPRK